MNEGVKSMWEIYDELISLVPPELEIQDYLAGAHWNLVRTTNVGMAMTPREGRGPLTVSGRVKGMSARTAAEYVKSWNNYEAVLGLATINATVNSLEKIAALDGLAVETRAQVNLFDYMLDEIRGKKVAVVGHFRGLEEIARQCQLSILERFPIENDLPDPACEYILPDQDYVFITGTTLINKTLPRLLQLSRGAVVSVVGPSTPLTPVLFDYGVDILAGTVVVDEPRLWRLIQEGDQHRFFSEGGQMVKIDKRRKVGVHATAAPAENRSGR